MGASESQADVNSLAFFLTRCVFYRRIWCLCWLTLGSAVGHLLVPTIKIPVQVNTETWIRISPNHLLTLHFGPRLKSSNGNIILTAFPKFLSVFFFFLSVRVKRICLMHSDGQQQRIWATTFEWVLVELSAVTRTSHCSNEYDLKHHNPSGLAVVRSHQTDSNSDRNWNRILSNWMEAFLLQHSCSPAD